MPTEKNFKRQVRQRMADTNERYTAARAALEQGNGRATSRAEPELAPWPDNDPAVEWLLASAEPAIRYRTLTDVLGRLDSDSEVRAQRAEILEGPKVREIFAVRNAKGGWGGLDYGHKYTGTVHVLTLLAQLRVPAAEAGIMPLVDEVLDGAPAARAGARVIDGRVRDHVGRDGAILDMAVLFGLVDDEPVRSTVEFILGAQWPDGGWNCDTKRTARNSSFMETVDATRGLFRYHAASGDERAWDAAVRSTDIFVRRGIIRSERKGTLISSRITQLHWPRGYDMLAAFEAIAPATLGDPRLTEALDLLESRRRKDGTWKANGPKPKVALTGPGEVADFATDGFRDRMVTLRALAVLRAARRLPAERPAAAKRRRSLRRTRRETLDALLADAGLDFNVEAIDKVDKDEDGTHSRVLLGNGTTCIFREYDTTSSMAEKYRMREEFLTGALADRGLPVPRLLATIAGSSGAGGDAAASLFTDGGGDPFERVIASATGASYDNLWATVGGMLRALHDAPIAAAGPLSLPEHQRRGTKSVAALAKTLNRVRAMRPETASMVDALLGLRPRLRKHLDARPVSITYGGRYMYPISVFLEETEGEWRGVAWLGWGSYVAVADPLRDIAAFEGKSRLLTHSLPPQTFYNAYGGDIDPLAVRVYGTAAQLWVARAQVDGKPLMSYLERLYDDLVAALA